MSFLKRKLSFSEGNFPDNGGAGSSVPSDWSLIKTESSLVGFWAPVLTLFLPIPHNSMATERLDLGFLNSVKVSPRNPM